MSTVLHLVQLWNVILQCEVRYARGVNTELYCVSLRTARWTCQLAGDVCKRQRHIGHRVLVVKETILLHHSVGAPRATRI